MKKALFIDRDGTLIVEPNDEQIDSLEKLEYLPGVFYNLRLISKLLDYEFVIVSNQDGLGTPAYPQEAFDLVQSRMLKAFKNEEIHFTAVHIDKSTARENLPTRKPGIGMLTQYQAPRYNVPESYVIGDRITDIELAKNLGCKGILISTPDKLDVLKQKGLEDSCALITTDWNEISRFLISRERCATVHRKTNETDIFVSLCLDGTGKADITTGLGFFDHMLEQIARHGLCDITINVKGDLHVDEHHTIEDTALALGEAFYKALGNKKGVGRYGFLLPMDDSLAQLAIDFGGRNWIEWDVTFSREKVGDLPTEMVYHFFKSFSDAARCNLNIKAAGDNEHHKIEAIFKALGRAVKMAVKQDLINIQLPSTKGVL